MEGNISRDLKKWRENAGLTQQQLADKVRVRRETVGHWENLEKPEKWPKEANCLKLSNILKIKVTKEGIIENNIEMKIDKEAPPSDSSQDEKEWYKRTIDSLIHENGQAMRLNTQTVQAVITRDEREIDSLKADKKQLWDLLTLHLKAPQQGQ